MNLTVNGSPHDHHGSGLLRELMREVGCKPGRTAVMVNGEVVPRSRWESLALAEADCVELIVFAGGG